MNLKNPSNIYFTKQDYLKKKIIPKKNNIFVKGIVILIKGYQKYISPLKGPSCRFYPTCSTYALQAFEKYGVLKGGYLAIRRISKCHPFNKGGYDPLP